MKMIIDNGLVFCHNIKRVPKVSACDICAFALTACPPNVCHLFWVLNYQPLTSCTKFCNGLYILWAALTGAIDNLGFKKICISLSCYIQIWNDYPMVSSTQDSDYLQGQRWLSTAGPLPASRQENGEKIAYPFF